VHSPKKSANTSSQLENPKRSGNTPSWLQNPKRSDNTPSWLQNLKQSATLLPGSENPKRSGNTPSRLQNRCNTAFVTRVLYRCSSAACNCKPVQYLLNQGRLLQPDVIGMSPVSFLLCKKDTRAPVNHPGLQLRESTCDAFEGGAHG